MIKLRERDFDKGDIVSLSVVVQIIVGSGSGKHIFILMIGPNCKNMNITTCKISPVSVFVCTVRISIHLLAMAGLNS